MKVTRVIAHENVVKHGRPLFVCSVVLDDCLMLSYIRLFQGEKGYYLCFPSKQDVYREVQDLNQGTKLEFPKIEYKDEDCTCKKYDEFYHPLEQMFYYDLLSIVLNAYMIWKETGKNSIRPYAVDYGHPDHVIENMKDVEWR